MCVRKGTGYTLNMYYINCFKEKWYAACVLKIKRHHRCNFPDSNYRVNIWYLRFVLFLSLIFNEGTSHTKFNKDQMLSFEFCAQVCTGEGSEFTFYDPSI